MMPNFHFGEREREAPNVERWWQRQRQRQICKLSLSIWWTIEQYSGEQSPVKIWVYAAADHWRSLCLWQATNENLVFPAKVIKELARELKNLDESPPEDIAVFVNEENFSNITADIEGPCTHFFCLLIFLFPIFCLCDNKIELPDSIHHLWHG